MRIRKGLSRPLGERGAALIEFTFVLSLLAMLAFGIVEFGLVFKNRLTISNATQGAARVASALGTSDESDLEMLLSLGQSIETLPTTARNNVRHVDVFLANSSGDPAGNCVTGDRCNRYLYQPGGSCDWNPCPDPSAGYASWDWAPSTRDADLPGLDVLGVEVSFAHSWVTGGIVPLPKVSCDLTAGSTCWSDSSIMRLEPRST